MYMIEKYYGIDSGSAAEKIAKLQTMKPFQHGTRARAFMFDDCVVLETKWLNFRNGGIRDEDMKHFDEIVRTLIRLHKQGAGVVPILGYRRVPKSAEGLGYVFMAKAKGVELWDDHVMELWNEASMECLANIYRESGDRAYLERTKQYILNQADRLAQAPQQHYDKFISDYFMLVREDIKVDAGARSNFFYDESIGFQFIDINSHTEYKYGLSDKRTLDKQEVKGFCACINRIAPNLRAAMTDSEYAEIVENNIRIFQKTKSSMIKNGFTEEEIARLLVEKDEGKDYCSLIVVGVNDAPQNDLER